MHAVDVAVNNDDHDDGDDDDNVDDHVDGDDQMMMTIVTCKSLC